MYHTDLRVNGRKITDETELKPFLECEQFTCEIGNAALQVEFSEESAAYIGWLTDDETDIYYLDNGSGDEEPYPLIDDVCPEERMMCYNAEDIWNIITYFCETGERNPKYKWTEDDFNWMDYVPRSERKFDKRHLPELYQNMHEMGYLTYPAENYVWMSEMEWMPYEEVINYEYEDGVTQEVLPFAFTGGGDPWVFIENGSYEPYIGLYCHPEEEGEYYAENFEDAILKNIIEFAEHPAIWLDEDGNPRDESENIEHKLESIHEQLREYCKVYEHLLRGSYLDVIAHLATLPFQKCTFNGNGHWLALLSHEDAEALIKQHLDFKQMDKTFIWYTDD